MLKKRSFPLLFLLGLFVFSIMSFNTWAREYLYSSNYGTDFYGSVYKGDYNVPPIRLVFSQNYLLPPEGLVMSSVDCRDEKTLSIIVECDIAGYTSDIKYQFKIVGKDEVKVFPISYNNFEEFLVKVGDYYVVRARVIVGTNSSDWSDSLSFRVEPFLEYFSDSQKVRLLSSKFISKPSCSAGGTIEVNSDYSFNVLYGQDSSVKVNLSLKPPFDVAPYSKLVIVGHGVSGVEKIYVRLYQEDVFEGVETEGFVDTVSFEKETKIYILDLSKIKEELDYGEIDGLNFNVSSDEGIGNKGFSIENVFLIERNNY